MRVRSGGCSNTGNIKAYNEDYWGVDPSGYIFILADGMSSAGGGEIASSKTCQSVVRALLPNREKLGSLADDSKPDSRHTLISALKGAVIRSEREIYDAIEANPKLKGIASTCDLLFLANGSAFGTHIGNGRIYLLRGETGRQLTLDHNVYEYLRSQGVEESKLANYPHKNKLIRALGMSGGSDIDTLQVDLRQGDRIVMCSDGLHRYIQSPTHLAQLCQSMDPQSAAEFLCQYALDKGGEDNVTVICIEVSDPGARSSAIETDSKITALGNISFFCGLNYQEMLQIMPITFEQMVEPNTEIIREGDEGENFYMLVSGKCIVTSGGVKIATLEPGAAFGELSLLDRQPRSATITSLEKCKLLVIRASDFERLTQSGTLAVKLLWNVVHDLSERLRKSSDKIRNQGLELARRNL